MSGRVESRDALRRSRDGSEGARRVWRDRLPQRLSLLRATYLEQRFTPHRQDTYVIGTNLRGRASCFGKPGLEVVPGSLVVIPPGQKHGGHRIGADPWVYLAAYPTHDYLLELQREITGTGDPAVGFSSLVYSDPELVAAFVRAHVAGIEGDDALAAESTMIEALALLLERYSGARARPLAATPVAPVAPVGRSIEFIEDHLVESLSLSDIAAASGYTRFHFLRVFKASLGETPHAYLMRRRVERAQSLLRAGGSIADVAYATGFSDQPHLTRRFRQIVGVTPGEFARGVGGQTASAA